MFLNYGDDYKTTIPCARTQILGVEIRTTDDGCPVLGSGGEMLTLLGFGQALEAVRKRGTAR